MPAHGRYPSSLEARRPGADHHHPVVNRSPGQRCEFSIPFVAGSGLLTQLKRGFCTRPTMLS